MKFSIIISKEPNTNLSLNALKFSESIIKSDNKINVVYFLGNGVYHSIKNLSENNTYWNSWLKLMQKNNVALFNCSSAYVKRGLKENKTISQIKITGLGELVNAIQKSDRVIKF